MLRDRRGHVAIEYVGVLVLAAILVAAIVTAGIPGKVVGAIQTALCPIVDIACGDEADAIAGTQAPVPDSDYDGIPDSEDASPNNPDSDGDGLSDGVEAALGSNPGRRDSDGDGVEDGEEYEQGTDPAHAIAPLTQDNQLKPWERLGISEDEWNEFADAILDEVNPDGLEGFLFGPAAIGVTLDENGEVQLIELQQSGIGNIIKVIAGSGRALSAAQAVSKALSKLPAALRTRLARLGVLRGATPRLARPPAPPANPGIALGAIDSLGRPIGASATITRDMIGTGTRASGSLRPPGFGGQTAGHARGHLIGRQLGGSGSDARNIVTLFQNPANTPAMSRFEGLVRRAVEAGETVRYTVTPIYRGSELVPRGVTLTARGSGGLRLDATVLNRPR